MRGVKRFQCGDCMTDMIQSHLSRRSEHASMWETSLFEFMAEPGKVSWIVGDQATTPFPRESKLLAVGSPEHAGFARCQHVETSTLRQHRELRRHIFVDVEAHLR